VQEITAVKNNTLSKSKLKINQNVVQKIQFNNFISNNLILSTKHKYSLVNNLDSI